jgi:chromatin modification-related protein VID21
MNQPNPLTNPAGMPNIAALQQSLHRNHPNLPADQVNKLANERLQQYQQHRMSQAALNAAAGNIGSIPTNFKIPTDPNDQQVPQPGVPNGAAAMQASQMQGYSPLMRVNQPGQPNRMNVNGSPAMNGMVIQQSRNATPQPHRTGSGQSGSTAPGKSPRHPQAQTASG